MSAQWSMRGRGACKSASTRSAVRRRTKGHSSRDGSKQVRGVPRVAGPGEKRSDERERRAATGSRRCSVRAELLAMRSARPAPHCDARGQRPGEHRGDRDHTGESRARDCLGSERSPSRRGDLSALRVALRFRPRSGDDLLRALLRDRGELLCLLAAGLLDGFADP